MAAVPGPFVSTVVRATRQSDSLRVTVPQVIATSLGLHEGDLLEWELDGSGPEPRAIIVRRPALREAAVSAEEPASLPR